jgi:putative ABC transport system substrate-binding protein
MRGHASRRSFLALSANLTMVLIPARGRGQSAGSPKVGVLLSGTRADYYSIADLADELRGTGAVITTRSADGYYDRLPQLIEELVAVSQVIVAFSLPSALAAKKATRTIPIVFTSGADPVAMGLVANLGRPEANLTGFTNYFGPIAGKRLELLRELVPNAPSIGVLINPTNANAIDHRQRIETAAQQMGQPISVVMASTEAEIAGAFERWSADKTGGIYVSDDPAYASRVALFVGLADRHALPVSYHADHFTRAGGLMSYGARIGDGVRVAGTYARRILQGEKVSNLPVQQPSKFHFAVNLATARRLQLVIPPSLLARADEVIE